MHFNILVVPFTLTTTMFFPALAAYLPESVAPLVGRSFTNWAAAFSVRLSVFRQLARVED
jgi:hypothetical protein